MLRDDLTQTVITLYTVKGIMATNKQPNSAKSLRDLLWLVANPTGSICTVGASVVSEWVYQIGSDYLAIDRALQHIFLPAHRLVGTLGLVKNSLSGIAYFTPNIMRPIFPVHIICEDAALLVSQTKSTLSVGRKIKACISKTGAIAKETIVYEMSQQLQNTLNSQMQQSAHAVINAVSSRIPTFSSSAAEPVQSSDWSSSLWNYASQVATTAPAFLVEYAASTVSTRLAETTQATTEKYIDVGISELNRQVEEKEHAYLNKVSAVVVDNTAKKAMTFCLSTGAGYFAAAYLIPNVTKWGLSYFLSEATAELVTTGVKVLAIGFTGTAIYATICQYGSDRQQNTDNLAIPLNVVQTSVVEGLSNKMNQLLPSTNNQFAFFKQNEFVNRCRDELPATFTLA